MDEEFQESLSVDDVDSLPDSTNEDASKKRSGSGLTLVLPSLKSLKANRSTKKSKSSASNYFADPIIQEKKAPRPVKLKPLKEVLTKLIAQIKKWVYPSH